ncbi:MAG: hypothetical protein ACYS8L_01260 [Planctomycetota bacterium]|jgi:hypothetical protein
MPSIDVKRRRIAAKIVYYGPGRAGKSENLRQIHELLDANQRGRLVSLPTKTDPNLYIDVLPVRFGKIIGFDTTFHLSRRTSTRCRSSVMSCVNTASSLRRFPT